MPKIDVTRFMEQSGMRKARFGGYEPDDVRAALQALCTEYEQRLGRAEAQARKAEQENAALQQHCQTLTAQNNRLSGQNAALAGSSSTYSRQKESLDAQVSALQERNHSLNDQVAVLRLKNGSLQKEKEKLQERADQAEAALRIKGRELDDARNALENGKEEIMQEARQKAEDIVANAHVRADQIKEDAQAEAQAMDVSARDQAKAQAQKLVDAAAAEANEIQNAHQLRLNNLRAEVREMEAQRAALIDYLGLMSRKLLNLQNEAIANDPGRWPPALQSAPDRSGGWGPRWDGPAYPRSFPVRVFLLSSAVLLFQPPALRFPAFLPPAARLRALPGRQLLPVFPLPAGRCSAGSGFRVRPPPRQQRPGRAVHPPRGPPFRGLNPAQLPA